MILQFLSKIRHQYLVKKGNALFLVLIAIALFGALSLAVMQSTESNEAMSRERERLVFSQMSAHASAISTAITRLVGTGQCMVGDGSLSAYTGTLNFYSEEYANPSVHNNTNAPTDGSCDIFSENGGGVAWQAPPIETGSSEYLIHAKHGIDSLWGNATGGTATQTFILYTHIPETMCLNYNTSLGINNPSGAPPLSYHCDFLIPATNSANTSAAGFWGREGIGASGTETDLQGQRTGCYECSGDGNFYYYNALYAR